MDASDSSSCCMRYATRTPYLHRLYLADEAIAARRLADPSSIPLTNRSVCFTPISQSCADILQDEMKRETM